jgi:hypothetical protein
LPSDPSQGRGGHGTALESISPNPKEAGPRESRRADGTHSRAGPQSVKLKGISAVVSGQASKCGCCSTWRSTRRSRRRAGARASREAARPAVPSTHSRQVVVPGIPRPLLSAISDAVDVDRSRAIPYSSVPRKGRSTSGWKSHPGKPPEEPGSQPPSSSEIPASKRGEAKLQAVTRVNPSAASREISREGTSGSSPVE